MLFKKSHLGWAVACALLLVACGEKSNPPAASAPQQAEVSVVTIQTEVVGLTSELPGRTEASRTAQVRARVPGIVLSKSFREGSFVKANELLFKIDPAPYQASVNSAQAALGKARANLAQADLKVSRYKPLAQANAVSRQDLDDALTAQQQAQADVASAQAALDLARLNLEYASVSAPISGRIGRSAVTEGALVGQGEATPLALIQQIDPIWVNLTQSSADYLKLKSALATGSLKVKDPQSIEVSLILENGQHYAIKGKLLFSDLTVDETTGSYLIRAEFPNPHNDLQPGMYVRAQLVQASNQQGILIPQQALMRNTDGPYVFVMDEQQKVQSRSVKVDNMQNDQWIISQGLKPGDQLITDNLQKIKPGMPVKPATPAAK
jgi:membrane fusion protein (multidrug efflux system)